MVATPQEYEVIITESAERSYFEILDYLFQHYSDERATQIALELLEEPFRLQTYPDQGSLEPALTGKNRDYRFILFERHYRATIKIIYCVDVERTAVHVTDFFPTEQLPRKLSPLRRV